MSIILICLGIGIIIISIIMVPNKKEIDFNYIEQNMIINKISEKDLLNSLKLNIEELEDDVRRLENILENKKNN